MPSYKPVAAALRALEVLASVNRLYGRATVGEIHRQTGIDKATVVRMLETLTHAGYIVRDPEEPAYRITGKTLMLSAAFDRHNSVGAIVAPLLDAFREEIGWPSDLALFDNDAMLVIESSRQGGPLSFNRAPGFRAPVLATSLGLAYIAHCPEAERAAFLARDAADQGPWTGLAREPARLAALLATVRRRGFATMDAAYSRQEYNNRISSIGVPVMRGETVFAALNVIYLKSALGQEEARTALLAPLQEVARRMADALAARHVV